MQHASAGVQVWASRGRRRQLTFFAAAFVAFTGCAGSSSLELSSSDELGSGCKHQSGQTLVSGRGGDDGACASPVKNMSCMFKNAAAAKRVIGRQKQAGGWQANTRPSGSATPRPAASAAMQAAARASKSSLQWPDGLVSAKTTQTKNAMPSHPQKAYRGRCLRFLLAGLDLRLLSHFDDFSHCRCR